MIAINLASAQAQYQNIAQGDDNNDRDTFIRRINNNDYYGRQQESGTPGVDWEFIRTNEISKRSYKFPKNYHHLKNQLVNKPAKPKRRKNIYFGG